mmetsp:Transcript_13653/g.34330  ORF Transcript_13653/g.34330 Transcript_13653/m.34330 type:complete len:203 (+) Transcript_13653:218-826(+)
MGKPVAGLFVNLLILSGFLENLFLCGLRECVLLEGRKLVLVNLKYFVRVLSLLGVVRQIFVSKDDLHKHRKNVLRDAIRDTNIVKGSSEQNVADNVDVTVGGLVAPVVLLFVHKFVDIFQETFPECKVGSLQNSVGVVVHEMTHAVGNVRLQKVLFGGFQIADEGAPLRDLLVDRDVEKIEKGQRVPEGLSDCSREEKRNPL